MCGITQLRMPFFVFQTIKKGLWGVYMSIKQRLISMIMSMLVGMFIIAGVLLWSMNDLRIGGKIYNQIISDKDLLADILPPPEYILESYLTVYQLLDAEQTDKSALWKTMDRLKSEYETRKQFWTTQYLPDNLQRLVVTSQQEADRFYRFVDEYQSHQNDEMTATVISKIQQAQMTHRAAIDLLVAESNGHFEQISLASEKSLSFDMWIVVSVFVFVICFAVIQGLFVLKRIMTPIKQIQLVIEKMTAGDFSVRTQADSHDQLSLLGQNLNYLLDSLQLSFKESIAVSAAFAHGDFGQRMSENLLG